MKDGLPLEGIIPMLGYIKDLSMLGTVVIPPGDSHLLEQPLYVTLHQSSITKNNCIRSVSIYNEEAATERVSILAKMRAVLRCWIGKMDSSNPGQ